MPRSVLSARLRSRPRLIELGERHQRLRDELDDVREQLADEIREAAEDGVAQVDIVAATGYTREAVRRIVSPAKRERVNAARRST